MRLALTLLIVFAKKHNAKVEIEPQESGTYVSVRFLNGQSVSAFHKLPYTAALHCFQLAQEYVNAH